MFYVGAVMFSIAVGYKLDQSSGWLTLGAIVMVCEGGKYLLDYLHGGQSEVE